MTRLRVGFISLGCPKNLVDSEVMMGILARSGVELVPDAALGPGLLQTGRVHVAHRPAPRRPWLGGFSTSGCKRGSHALGRQARPLRMRRCLDHEL